MVCNQDIFLWEITIFPPNSLISSLMGGGFSYLFLYLSGYAVLDELNEDLASQVHNWKMGF